MADDIIHFCGLTEADTVGAAPWRKRALSWRVQGGHPTLAPDQVRVAFSEATASIAAVCGLSFANTQGDPDILITWGKIDGPFGVLAWSELADGSDRQLTQKYDTSERYVIALTPGNGTIDLVAVCCHELIHALGLDHTPSGTGDLMEPTYKPGRRVPQPGDIRRLVALYGPPVAAPPPPPPPHGEPRVATVMRIYDAQGAQMAAYKIERTE